MVQIRMVFQINIFLTGSYLVYSGPDENGIPDKCLSHGYM